MSLADEQKQLRNWISVQTSRELKNLLENKHLYQKFTIDLREEAEKLGKKVTTFNFLQQRFFTWD